MICYNCQQDIAVGSRYCYHCGASQRTTTPPPPPREPGSPLRRSRTDKIIGGVCAGFARHFDLDTSLVRVVWLLVGIFAGGSGFIAYLVCWIIIPLEEVGPVPSAAAPPSAPPPTGG